jgi:hypothetical protein
MRVPKSMKQICSLACFFLLLLQTSTSYSQVYGCKDPAANNYNSSATVNDGSCLYDQTFYTPPIKVDPISNALVETSGLQWAGNSLWSFNDGGYSATLFRIDTASDAILQTVSLEGASNVDWEDIAFDGTYFYIGDFGNNANGARTDLKIYKFPLSAVPDYATHPAVSIPSNQIEVIQFTYSDQVQPPVATGVNSTKFDCEAMIIDGGKIHLFSKNWINVTTTHYVIDGTTAGTYVATPVETLATDYLVTAADKVPGSNVVVLTGYQNSGTGNHFLHLLSDFRDGLYFNGNKRRIDLPNAAEMGQVEGISFRNNSYGYISNEKFERTVLGFTVTVNQKLRSFNTSQFLSSAVLSLSLLQFDVTPANGPHQIRWHFSAPVHQLRIQHSRNRLNFTTLQTYDHGGRGSFLHRSPPGTNYYRLIWREGNGAERYSTVLQINGEAKSQLSNLVLLANGQLQVVNNSNQPADYWAKLIAVDGRTIAGAARFKLLPGVNKVSFNKQLSRNTILLLQLTNGAEEMSKLLRVE